MKAQGYTKETIMNTAVTAGKFPQFNVGDTIAVYLRVKEGDKERIQLFQGDVLAIKHGAGDSATFTVRKIGAHTIAVERIIPFNSPLLKEIKVLKRGAVRRAKLYYVRKRVGKAARFKEKREHKVKNTTSAGTKQAVTSLQTASQEQMSAKSSK